MEEEEEEEGREGGGVGEGVRGRINKAGLEQAVFSKCATSPVFITSSHMGYAADKLNIPENPY